jgi:tetratricopeptide (TPR) repeat protein
MSRIEKEVKELLDLAKLTNDESAFQQNHRYRKFKKDNYKLDIEICDHMIKVLQEIKFFNECVFWCEKILENSRVGEKHFRLHALTIITNSFYYLEKYGKAIEYGKKAIEYKKGLIEHDLDIDNNHLTILNNMTWASIKLGKKKEAMEYARELLKVSVILYNAKYIEKYLLLISYLLVSYLQVHLGESKLAKKSFERHFKLFNLNSPNPNDVLLALKEEEGYEDILPLANSKQTQKLSTEFAKKFIHSQESMDYWLKKVYIFHKVGQMCWNKHIVYFGGTSDLNWGNLSLDVCVDILKHTKLIIENKEKLGNFNFDLLYDFCNEIVLDAISMTLLLADQNHLKRENLFSNVFLLIRSLMADPNMKNISYYFAEAQLNNDSGFKNFGYVNTVSRIFGFSNSKKINLQKVMPFIQFCLKSLDKEGASSNENIDLKWKFVMLKNNLIIMNHFKTNGREEVKVNLFQKHLFLHQLTYDMTKDCSLNYKFST